jgi:hypothetical protein
MANNLPPIPKAPIGEDYTWREWFYNLGRYIQVVNAGGTPWTVPQGGTGVGSITGWVKGNGTSALSGHATIPYTDISGTPSLTGYVPYTGATTDVDLGTHSLTAQQALLGPGSATAGTAPLYFTAGTDLTTPEEGAVEFHNGHLHISPVAGVRNTITTSNGVKTTTTTVVNTTTETTVYSYTFVANEMHSDEHIEFRMTGAYSNASAADDFTIRFKVGGTTLMTVSRTGGNVTDQGWKAIYEGTIRSIGASGTLVDFAQWTDGNTNQLHGDATIHTIDTTASLTFEVTVQWAAAKAGNTFSCTQGFLTFNH